MAKFKHLSLHHDPPLACCQGRCATGFQNCVVHIVRVLFVVLIGFVTFAPDVAADAWLDRVERNLRRIESASKYSEPAGAGSKQATKTHRACIHKNDKDACEKLIWRSPELLPVRDWAVGTAHIKRGEMREQSGDVSGAIEDYSDALGYHEFPNLSARIKRLELRQKRDQQRAVTAKVDQVKEDQAPVAESNKEMDASNASATPNSSATAVKVASRDPNHPIVVVAGWAATVADKDQTDNTAKANPVSDARPPSSEPVKLSGTSSLNEADKGSTATQNDQQSTPGPAQIEVGSIAKPPVPVRIARAPTPNNASIAARYVPGPQVLESKTDGSDGGTNPVAQPAPQEVEQGAELRERPLRATQVAPSMQHQKLHFNVNEEVARSLERVRTKTDDVLTTSSLPDRGYGDRARQRSLMSLAVMAMLTMMLFSTVAIFRGWRPSLPMGFPKQERKPVLSVEDLEHLIKNRTAETLATKLPPQTRAHVKIGSIARVTANTVQRANVGVAADDQSKTPTTPSAVPYTTSKAPTTDAEYAQTKSGRKEPQVTLPDAHDEVGDNGPDAPTNADGQTSRKENATDDASFDVLESSLLRRVSYGAASLIVVADRSASACREALVAKVDEARRSELLARCHVWDVTQSEAEGVLNPFAVLGGTDDPLAARQQFNAAFEFHSSIFESVFGARFVYDQKVMLRHLVMVMQTLPDPSLKTLYSMLKSPRSLEPLREALAELDNVSTRMFFTTVFASEEFSDKADYMRSRLASVVENELVTHLCCRSSNSAPVQEVFKEGRLVLLGMDPDSISPAQRAVIVRSLLSVLALQNFAKNSENTGEIAATVFLPGLTNQIGGLAADVAFLLSQVKQAGYNVL